MKKYNICMVGIGAVGTEIVRLLRKRNFPLAKLTAFATRERTEMIDGLPVEVKVATGPESFKGYDFAFFAGTEGAKGASKTLGWGAAEAGCIVIDNGDDFRMDPRVPLCIPEINAEALKNHQNFIANPNCSTAIALMPLYALHREARIKRIVCCTYQAVSGSGSAAIRELEEQTRAWAAGQPITHEVYPAQIAFNVIAQIGSEAKDLPGYTSEEAKLGRETRKILGDDAIQVVSTCVRVPVFNGHSEALHVEFHKPLTPERARAILEQSAGVTVVDDLSQSLFPMPIDCSGKYDVLVGRIRKDPSIENGLALFVAGDNIWKGAAQNAIQIAEKMIAMGLK
ncbi:MAG: aspartate-semialdehyde dehydrogenase [Kiritimatiellae bacterium]|jgi:aspartate-semialdehyde dehydrogenase|nr:aspartate-semialdehyde dehydrogenase [Kiritimatiellia bacterium]NLD89883.1 aspartate-semialdehyde dehydrogenase [Lentisphaerota bacterium]HOU21775.1 aspartate-semialdehyde dehydrogenase [Kiritimatiellia bacterium]HPC18943.1 aspartate-semialdehyde dehydrogenase [Kiritimatiellia bacterium]